MDLFILRTHVESLVLILPCNHPSRVKLHTSSDRSHDTVAPLWLDTCTTFDPLLTDNPSSPRDACVTALLQLVVTWDKSFLYFSDTLKEAALSFFSVNHNPPFFKVKCLWFTRPCFTCPLCWMLMVLLFIPIRRKLCGSEVRSSVNEGSALTSWARSSGQEPGSSYRWPSNVTTNWSATNKAWSWREKQKERDIIENGSNPAVKCAFIVEKVVIRLNGLSMIFLLRR